MLLETYHDLRAEQIGCTVGFLASVMLTDSPERPVAGPLSAAVSHLRREWADLPLRRVSVASLAAAASISRGYLNRLFQAEFGLSAAAALEHARCSRVETLLTRTDLTIGAVAWQCGFASPSRLSHRFTAIHGMPPAHSREARACSTTPACAGSSDCYGHDDAIRQFWPPRPEPTRLMKARTPHPEMQVLNTA